MNNDISSKLNSILSAMDPKDLQKLVQMTKNSGIASRLTPTDRQKLINEFAKLDSADIKKKLSSLNSADLSKLSADDLIRKLRTN